MATSPQVQVGGKGTAHRTVEVDCRIKSVLRAIEEDPAQQVQSLARLVNLSSSRLSHLFKGETRCSLKQFLLQRRLETAVELLRDTALSIKEVSYQSGYGHPPSFVRAFRQRFGCSPNYYRRRWFRLRNDSRFG